MIEPSVRPFLRRIGKCNHRAPATVLRSTADLTNKQLNQILMLTFTSIGDRIVKFPRDISLDNDSL